MNLKVLHLNNAADIGIYKNTLSLFKSNYPYYLIDFMDTFSLNLKDAKVFLFEDANETVQVVMPFYCREILFPSEKTKYFDVVSSYGYNGPLFNKNIDVNILKLYWEQVDAWYKEQNVISEFIRFNLNDNHIGYSGHIIETQLNIKGKLLEPEQQWANYDRKVRKNVNKATRNNLTVAVYHKTIPDHIIEDFYRIYIDTMDRSNATKEFYYDKAKVSNFIKKSTSNVAIAIVYKEDVPISSELILVSATNIYSFLGGTIADYFNLRPNDILKHEVANWAFKNGFSYYVLGGGYGGNDGIYNYKKSFFPSGVVTYYTGRKIVNQEIYKALTLQQGISYDTYDFKEDFFPIYRKNDQ